MCPASSNHPAIKNCDRATEVCGLVKVVDVKSGFKYREDSAKKWFWTTVLMTTFGSWIAAPYTMNNDMQIGWMYNFWTTNLTWGI